ncbi:hypothetical protein [Roseivirga sp.]|uniref:hypothetical protein n=1 Tax=Roseivirga sp. TaxID=1964215 RepID=UPI003B8B71EE
MFTNEQLDFLTSKKNFLIKNEVDQEVAQLLNRFQSSIAGLIDNKGIAFPSKVSKLPTKITKGNNHNGFPFQVSDYPANLSKDNIFTFRATIWYGNIFSFAVILSGEPKLNYREKLKTLLNKGFSVTLNEEVWQTEITPQNTLPFTDQNTPLILNKIRESESFKIFKSFKMNHISDFERLGIDCFKELFLSN